MIKKEIQYYHPNPNNIFNVNIKLIITTYKTFTDIIRKTRILNQVYKTNPSNFCLQYNGETCRYLKRKRIYEHKTNLYITLVIY